MLDAAQDAPENISALASLMVCKAGTARKRAKYLSNIYTVAPNPRIMREWVDHHRHLLRDIFGNPFRPVACDTAWLTSDVIALACGIYDERAFDRTPILADALQDAGCDSADVLDHCRGAGPHVRGCWVVDLLLGKA
jgi:hypothetical protein